MLSKKTMKVIATCVVVCLAASLFAVTCFATGETTPEVSSVLQDSFSSVIADITSAVMVILPICLGLLGTVLGIKYGINFFKKITNKAG